MSFAGYTIPAGWPIMIVTSTHHLNSEIFNDPLAFNPRRWKVKIKIIATTLNLINEVTFDLDCLQQFLFTKY